MEEMLVGLRGDLIRAYSGSQCHYFKALLLDRAVI